MKDAAKTLNALLILSQLRDQGKLTETDFQLISQQLMAPQEPFDPNHVKQIAQLIRVELLKGNRREHQRQAMSHLNLLRLLIRINLIALFSATAGLIAFIPATFITLFIGLKLNLSSILPEGILAIIASIFPGTVFFGVALKSYFYLLPKHKITRRYIKLSSHFHNKNSTFFSSNEALPIYYSSFVFMSTIVTTTQLTETLPIILAAISFCGILAWHILNARLMITVHFSARKRNLGPSSS
jgi:hypothetical protein